MFLYGVAGHNELIEPMLAYRQFWALRTQDYEIQIP